MKRVLRLSGILAAGAGLLWLVIGLSLALSPEPAFDAPALHLPSQALQTEPDICTEGTDRRCFEVRDGTRLSARVIDSDAERTVLLLHGVLGSAVALQQTAQLLHEASGARIVLLDLRGHGSSGGRRGDTDYIGQYEDDVVDVVATLRRERPGAQIILGGHSMGGGIALRYATRPERPPVDGYLLFAPHLGSKSPTTRTRPPEPAEGVDAEPRMKVHIKRTIGLVMLNIFGVRALNGLETLFFNLGEGFAIRAYSFRAMAGMAPEDYRSALGADRLPLLAIIGEDDEAFHAAEYPAAISLHENGRATVIPGAAHGDVMHHPEAITAIRDWLAASYR